MQGIREDLVSKIHELASDYVVVLERIDRIEESRDRVKESVYLKVLQDYQDRLNGVSDQLQLLARELLSALQNGVGDIDALARDAMGLEEQLEELELRMALGEYDEVQGRLRAEEMNSRVRAYEQAQLILNSMRCALGDVGESLIRFCPDLGRYFETSSADIPENSEKPVAERVQNKVPDVPSSPEALNPVSTPESCSFPSDYSASAIIAPDELAALDKLGDVDEDDLLRRADSFLAGSSDSQVDIDDLDSMDDDDMPFGADIYNTPPFGLKSEEDEDTSREVNLSEMGMVYDSPEPPFQEERTMKTPFIGQMANETPSRPRPAISSAPPFLIMKNNVGADQEFQLSSPEMAIGRAQDNDIILLDKTVSRHHTLISREDRGFVLVDLNSTKGTFVNGQRAEQKVLLDNDRILIGSVTFIYRESRP
ncbi:MAG: hypothetical protein CVV64_09730 [Candidatus Wallbacteria bacterium HGW-Wallbacteria-1]|uniref:FHA domain-containing protein n=1 Tax=Candidatus Wallbacteria bacterium HGW-Wallbacteria-1 TaxID=2013854 RepID=A0A2N1PQM8_9BACT|nr:MAG: hypothetical protein CVV64_09730 [Candidatus Wallbacteria bacterium HGW-Wallbacteria-1]